MAKRNGNAAPVDVRIARFCAEYIELDEADQVFCSVRLGDCTRREVHPRMSVRSREPRSNRTHANI